MKKINNNHIEQALVMHKETVSPQINCLQEILSHIPEKKIIENRRAVRSPYTWLAISQVVTVFTVLFVIIGVNTQTFSNNEEDIILAYQLETEKIDEQIFYFETTIDEEDYQKTLENEPIL